MYILTGVFMSLCVTEVILCLSLSAHLGPCLHLGMGLLIHVWVPRALRTMCLGIFLQVLYFNVYVGNCGYKCMYQHVPKCVT